MSNKALSFFIALFYIVISTIYAYFRAYNGIDFGWFGIIFAPVSIFPELIFFTERNPAIGILICQSISLVVVTALVWGFVNAVRTESQKN